MKKAKDTPASQKTPVQQAIDREVRAIEKLNAEIHRAEDACAEQVKKLQRKINAKSEIVAALRGKSQQ